MPPGWRPRNLPPYAEKPAHSAETQIKFTTKAAPGSRPYLVIQLALMLVLMLAVIRSDSPLVLIDRAIVAFALWVAITIWAGFLSSARWAMPIEFIRVTATWFLLTGLATSLTGVEGIAFVGQTWSQILYGLAVATVVTFTGFALYVFAHARGTGRVSATE